MVKYQLRSFFLLLSSLSLSYIAAAQELGGPIPLRNQFPLTAAHLSFLPQDTAVLAQGQAKVTVSSAWSNSFILKDSYEVDAESVELRARGRLGLGNEAEVALDLPFQWMGGGVLDTPIDNWHRFWGFPRGQRGERPANSYAVSGVTEEFEGFNLPADGMRMGNPVLGGKMGVLGDSESSVSIISELSFPKLTSGYAHQGVDLSLGAVGTERLSWGAVHYGGALFGYSSSGYKGVPVAPLHGEGFLSAEWAATQRLALIATVLGATQTVRDIQGFPLYSIYLDLGARLRISPSSFAVVAFRENPAPHYGTTDISFMAILETHVQ